MADIDVDIDTNRSSDTLNDTTIPDSIPGGRKHVEPEEPTLSKEQTQDQMGCASSPGVTVDDADEENKPIGKHEQPKTEKRNGDAHQKTNDQSQKKSKMNDKVNARPVSKTYAQSVRNDEDHENDPKQRRSSPVTRSSASLSPLRFTFDDSDDDDSSHSSYAQRDIAEYRNNYPNTRSNPKIKDNYDFYTNQISSHPDGDLIDNIHTKWFSDYRKLEYHHGYIQWLFPLQERGLNWSAEPLQKHEIESIKKDKKALGRVLTSYKLMLDFYGFKLVDEKTGKIRRLSDNSYKERFRNLNTSSHNYLRITRILKCLGEFDYEYLKFPFLETILYESIIEGTLSNCLRSCRDYWIETLRSHDERRNIRQYARELIEYRNKGITPPKSHHAIRPTSTSATTQKVEDMSLSESDDENISNH